MKIYVVRHGQTDYNINGLFQGRKDIPLNSVGIKQAEETAQKFKNIPVDIILVSPLTRAKETAKYISNVTGIKPVIEQDLIERNFGDMEGKPNREDCNIKMLLDYERNYNICNVEPIQSLFKRVSDCLDKIIDKYMGKNVVLVTHGGVAQAIDCYFNDFPENKDLQSIALKNCEVREYVPNERLIDKIKNQYTNER